MRKPNSPIRPVSDKVALFRNHPLFRHLAPPILERISAYCRRRTAAKGSTIFKKGDPGTGLIGVLAGAVKISVTSEDGRDIVLNTIREGEVFGEIALLDGHPRTADATAISDCELFVLERREFIPFLRTQPDVILKLVEILCSRLRKTSDQVHELTFLSLSSRLAKTLLRLTENTGDLSSGRRIAISQREMSELVGRSRESTNKQLRMWHKVGWVRLERRSVTVLKPEKLAEVVTMSSDLDRL